MISCTDQYSPNPESFTYSQAFESPIPAIGARAIQAGLVQCGRLEPPPEKYKKIPKGNRKNNSSEVGALK
jgi:hypothetical protein